MEDPRAPATQFGPDDPPPLGVWWSDPVYLNRNISSRRCLVCGEPLHRYAVENGERIHANCLQET